MTGRHRRSDRSAASRGNSAWMVPVVGVLTALGLLAIVVVGQRLPGVLAPIALVALPMGLLGAVLSLRDHRWALAVFAAALPAGLMTLVGGVQVVQVCAAWAIVAVALRRMGQGQPPLALPAPVVALLLLVAWSVLLSPGAADLPRAARWNVALLSAALLVAAVVTATHGRVERLRAVALLLFAGSVATCALALPESTQRRSFGAAVVEGRAQGVFNQPNELGLFAGTTVVMGLALLVSVRGRRHPRAEGILLAVGGAVALIALALSLSRGAWIGTALAVVVAMVLVPGVRRIVLIGGASATVLMTLAIATASLPDQLNVIGARVGLITDRGANPYDERPAIWTEGLRQVREYPWTGVGAAGFTEASARSDSAVVASVRPAHAHNVLLNFSAEGGVLAGLALLAAIVLTAVAVFTGRSRPGWLPRDRAFLGALGCVPLVVLGQGLLDAPIRNPTTLLHTAAALGLAVAVGYVRPLSQPEIESATPPMTLHADLPLRADPLVRLG